LDSTPSSLVSVLLASKALTVSSFVNNWENLIAADTFSKFLILMFELVTILANSVPEINLATSSTPMRFFNAMSFKSLVALSIASELLSKDSP
jgi:hypothetical protein